MANHCNQLDLGLLVGIWELTLSVDQYKAGKATLVQLHNPQAIYTNNWT
jgi:hypothetical protein